MSRSVSLGLSGVVSLAAAFALPGIMISHGLSLTEASQTATWLNGAWVVCAFMLLCFSIVVGGAINGRPAGLIIDNRNRISLSKFQATAWSILILSTLITALFARIAKDAPMPANIDIPLTLLAVMGISTASLVATPVILSVKRGQEAGSGHADDTARALGDDIHASVGTVYARTSATGAAWLDMFRGEDVNNAACPDLSKIQNFIITIAVIIGYGATIWAMFAAGIPADLKTWLWLPDFGDKILLLIGISHAGYLAYKIAPHGSSQDAVARSSGDNAAG